MGAVREWREPLAWWQVPGELARLLRYLDEVDGPTAKATLMAVVEAPEVWSDEYEEMCRAMPHRPYEREEDLSPLLEASIAIARAERGR